jgi:hypothetical protein
MSATVTAWTLAGPQGRVSRCLIKPADGRRDVIVWNGPSIVLWERCASEEAAHFRADELWTLLVAHAWVPPEQDANRGGGPEPFRRGCPECQQQTGRVTNRRNAFLVLACDACGFRWNARARTAAGDRRLAPRAQPDRRRAA